MTQRTHRVGIFGGTFNPIHYGHLMIAENAREQFGLEQVIFLPTGHTPHKEYMGKDMSIHRCHMVEMAIADNPHFTISFREVESETVNYTYQTLQHYNEEEPDTTFYFILGADSLFDFSMWRRPELICQEAVILAAVRDDLNEKKVDAQIRALKDRFGGEIYRLDTPAFPVSSRDIRERINRGQSIRYLIPDSVMQYIREKQLYLSH